MHDIIYDVSFSNAFLYDVISCQACVQKPIPTMKWIAPLKQFLVLQLSDYLWMPPLLILLSGIVQWIKTYLLASEKAYNSIFVMLLLTKLPRKTIFSLLNNLTQHLQSFAMSSCHHSFFKPVSL